MKNETFEKLLAALNDCRHQFAMYSLSEGVGTDEPISKMQLDRAETLIKSLAIGVDIVRLRAGSGK